jgi:hypothetical protein
VPPGSCEYFFQGPCFCRNFHKQKFLNKRAPFVGSKGDWRLWFSGLWHQPSLRADTAPSIFKTEVRNWHIKPNQFLNLRTPTLKTEAIWFLEIFLTSFKNNGVQTEGMGLHDHLLFLQHAHIT